MFLKNQKINKKGFTLIELMVVIVIIGILVAIALPNFIAAQDRAKASSVKANMHTWQTMVETYGVDWGGTYPNGIVALVTDGQIKNYYKDFTNPFSGRSSTLGLNVSFADFLLTPGVTPVVNTVLTLTSISDSSGLVVHSTSGQAGTITKYWVYGVAKDKLPLADKGQVLVLSNN